MPATRPLLPEPVEPPGRFLFDDLTISNLTDQERKHGIYTAERCPPKKREDIKQLLAELKPIREIARLCEVHQSTVTAVADKFGQEITDIRARLARKLRRVVWSQADRLEQFPDSLPASSIPLAIKLLGEHAELLDGKATSRTEIVERIDVFSDFQAFLASLEMDAKKGPVGIGDEGGKKALIAGSAADPSADRGAAAELGAGLGSGLVIDCESSVSGPITEGDRDDGTGFGTGLPPAPDPKPDAPGSPGTPPGGGLECACARNASDR